MRKLLIGFIAIAAALQGQSAPSQSTLKAFAAGACGEVMGVDCTTDPGQINLYYDILSFIGSQPIPSRTQETIVRQYLMPFVGARINMKQAIVDRAFIALGRTATPPDETRWLGTYNSWQTYQRLVPMIRAALPTVPYTPPAPPQINQQQQQQAIQAAFQKVWMRAPSASEAGQFSSLQPAQVEGTVRSMLSRYPGEAPRIVDAVFAPTIRRQPTAYERTGVISVFGRYWTGADDLATYLNGARASYNTPNSGPQAAPAGTPISPGTYLSYGNTPLSPSILGPGGYLLNIKGATIIAAGGGNYIDTKTGILTNAGGNAINISRIVAAGGGNVISNDGGSIVAAGGGNIVAAGGGNIVAAGGGNIVAAGGGNIVAAGGGNMQPLFAANGFGLYDASLISQLVQRQAAASLQVSQNSSASILANISNMMQNSANLGGGGYGLNSVGSSPQQLADNGNGDAMVALAKSSALAKNPPTTYQWLYLASVHTGSVTNAANRANLPSAMSQLWAGMPAAQQQQASAGINQWKATHPGK